jgi:hypothetical protein
MGLTPFIYGLAIALGTVYPRWAGSIAVASGVALMYNGVVEVAPTKACPVDRQTGWTRSLGRVGVQHGRVDVAHR